MEGDRGRGGSARSWGLVSAIRLSRYRDALSAVSAHSPALTRTGSQALGQGSEPVRSERSTPGPVARHRTRRPHATPFFTLSLSLSLSLSLFLSLSLSLSFSLSHFLFLPRGVRSRQFRDATRARASLSLVPLRRSISKEDFRDEDQRGARGDESMARRLVGFG